MCKFSTIPKIQYFYDRILAKCRSKENTSINGTWNKDNDYCISYGEGVSPIIQERKHGKRNDFTASDFHSSGANSSLL
jgi:hypothetical protein